MSSPITIALIIVGAVVLLGLAIIIVRRRRAAAAPAASDEPFHSFVWLLRRPRRLDVPKLQVFAQRAFGVRFNSTDPSAVVLEAEPGRLFVVRCTAGTLGVVTVSEPYVEDIADAADSIRDFELKEAIQRHVAWVSVDLLGEEGALPDEEMAYAAIGKMAAELAADDCLALYSVRTGQLISYADDLLPILRSENPRAAFDLERPDEVTEIDEDDPRLLAAAAEARKRWPEFLAAFEQKRPQQGFAVKVPFHEGEEVEYMWVEVSKIEGEAIHGQLANEPAVVKTLKLDDPVQVNLKDLNDWIYSDGDHMVGGFTEKAMS